MTTFALLRTSIDNWMSRDDLATGPDIGDIVRMAESTIARRVRVRDQEVTTTLACTSRSTALPADYIDMRSVSLDSSMGRAMDYLTPETIRETNVWSNTSGSPTAYTIENSNIVLAPEPGADGITLDIVYFAKYAALSADSDTNWLLTNHYDLYLHACLMNASILIKDFEAGKVYKSEFERVVNELEKSEGRSRFMVGSALVSHGHPRAIV